VSSKQEEIDIIRASEYFDADWYSQRYGDVGLSGICPATHYLLFGGMLQRDPGPRFNAREYLARNPDAEKSGENPLLHFLRHGQACETKAAFRQPDGVPHYGRAFHRIVEAARARTKPQGVSEEYDTIRAEFDIAYYLMRYPDLARAANIDPIQHYMRHGASEERDPSPHFSTKRYWTRYPEVAESGLNPFYHWLTIGRDKGYIAEAFTEFDAMCGIVGRDPVEVQRLLTEKRKDLRARLEHGALGEMVAKAAELEPLIAHSWREALQVKLPPFHSDQMIKHVVALHRLQQQAQWRRAKAVVVIPHCRMSGAARVAGYLANALAQIYGPDELVVVRTDLDVMRFPEWFPQGCRHVSFAAVEKLPRNSQEKLLVELLRSLHPEVVFNVNSRLFWDAMQPFGKALSASTALYAYMFCNDMNLFGHWNGYPLQKFYRYFDILSGIMVDNHNLAEELAEMYLVPSAQTSKIVTLETPVSALPSIAPAPVPGLQRRPQVFWASRFDRQKRVDLVMELARTMPDVDFRLWGEPVLDANDQVKDAPPNVSLEGVYEDLAQVPLGQCDLWLYTSQWDGVPNILIDIATRGIPIVGSLVGGTGEVLKEGLSWPVTDIENVEAYEAAIREVLCDPVEARRRALRLREEIAEQRTTENYIKALESALPKAGNA